MRDTLGKYSILLACALSGQHKFRKKKTELGHSIVFFTTGFYNALHVVVMTFPALV